MRSLNARKLRAIAGIASAASHNEQTTRERVEALERWAQAFSGLSFWGRLKWLIRGA